MVVAVSQDQVKNKELILEIDSIVTDNKDNLANVSLSSNDSLSGSRRKWRLIRIINRLNPALAKKSQKFSFLRMSFFLFITLLTCVIIYWSLSSRSKFEPSNRSIKCSSSQSEALQNWPPSTTPKPPSLPPTTPQESLTQLTEILPIKLSLPEIFRNIFFGGNPFPFHLIGQSIIENTDENFDQDLGTNIDRVKFISPPSYEDMNKVLNEDTDDETNFDDNSEEDLNKRQEEDLNLPMVDDFGGWLNSGVDYDIAGGFLADY